MKRIILFIIYLLFTTTLTTFSQSLTVTPATVKNGGIVTLTATGETIFRHYKGNLFLNSVDAITTEPSGYGLLLNITEIKQIQEFKDNSKVSKYTFKISHPFPYDIKANIPFRCKLENSFKELAPEIINDNYITSISITVKEDSTKVFYNTAQTTVFTKQCSSTEEGTKVPYTVSAKEFRSLISQADADKQAQDKINAKGQANANEKGQCLFIYYSTVVLSGSFVKNDCGSGYTPGPAVSYTVPAGKHKSTVSLEAANALANNDFNINGQINANNNGICNEIRSAYLTKYRTEVCNISNETTTSLWIRNIDFSTIQQNNSSTGIYAFTSEIGNTKAAPGYYSGLYTSSSDGNFNRVYTISSSGEITGYTLCPKVNIPPAGTNTINVSALSYEGNNSKKTIKIDADGIYSKDITVTGNMQAYNSSGALLKSQPFQITLVAGSTTASADMTMSQFSNSGNTFKITSVAANPKVVDNLTILFNINKVW